MKPLLLLSLLSWGSHPTVQINDCIQNQFCSLQEISTYSSDRSDVVLSRELDKVVFGCIEKSKSTSVPLAQNLRVQLSSAQGPIWTFTSYIPSNSKTEVFRHFLSCQVSVSRSNRAANCDQSKKSNFARILSALEMVDRNTEVFACRESQFGRARFGFVKNETGRCERVCPTGYYLGFEKNKDDQKSIKGMRLYTQLSCDDDEVLPENLSPSCLPCGRDSKGIPMITHPAVNSCVKVDDLCPSGFFAVPTGQVDPQILPGEGEDRDFSVEHNRPVCIRSCPDFQRFDLAKGICENKVRCGGYDHYSSQLRQWSSRTSFLAEFAGSCSGQKLNALKDEYMRSSQQLYSEDRARCLASSSDSHHVRPPNSFAIFLGMISYNSEEFNQKWGCDIPEITAGDVAYSQGFWDKALGPTEWQPDEPVIGRDCGYQY